eukprot:3484772-Pleurochrysis_carterae.AAC.2
MRLNAAVSILVFVAASRVVIAGAASSVAQGIARAAIGRAGHGVRVYGVECWFAVTEKRCRAVGIGEMQILLPIPPKAKEK